MDKLEKLYNLYLKEGIISNATSFEKWKAADSVKQEKLFEIGKSKGLFKTSTVDKFKAAWGDTAIPEVKKKGMVSPSEDGSLDSSETDVISQEDLLQQTVTPSDQLETKPTDTQVDFELGFQNIPEQQLTEKLVSTPSEEKDDFAGTILSEQPPKAFSEPVVQDGVSVAEEVEYDPFKESVDRVVNKELLTDDLSSFGSINPGIAIIEKFFTEADATEENVIPQMQYYFGEYGFEFEPADALGDGMTVKASNGKQTYVNLDGVFGGEQAAKDLKKFLIENKEENAVERESNKVIDENRKIYKEQEIKDAVSVMNTQAQEWNNSFVELTKLKESNEQMAKELVGISQSDIESDPSLKQKLDMYNQNLDAEKQFLKLVTDKSEEFKVKGARLDMLAGEYYEMKSKQGSYSSGIMAGIFGRGPANIASGAVSYGVDAYTYLAKNRSLTEEKYRDELIRIGKEEGYLPKDEDFSGVSKEEIIERLGGDTNDAKPFFDGIFLAGKQALGFDPIGREAEKEALGEPTNFDKVNDKVKDYARKGIKYYNDYGVEGLDYDKAVEGRYRNPFSQIAANLDTEMGIVDASLASGEMISENIGAPKEWADLEKQSFWGGAILGLSESIPAMVGGMDKIGFVQRTAQMFMMTSSHLDQEMNKNPLFDNISESEKIPIKVGLSSVVAVLESLGFRNVMSRNAYIPTLILSRVLKKVPKGSTQRTLREYIQQDVESSIARGGYSLLAAGAAEFETGFAQEAADILIKNIYNDLKEKEMFETPESWGDIVFQMVYAGGQEAVGGFILGSPGAISSAVAGRQDVQSLDERDWKNFELLSNDPTYDKMYVQKLKAEIADPENSKTLEEAQAELNSVRRIQGLLKNNKQNISNLSAEKKKRAVQLLIQQQKLEEEIKNGNKQLSKSKRELLDDVNKELENLGMESQLIEISERAKEGGIQEFKGTVIDWIKGLGKTKDIGDVMEGGIEIDMDGTKVIMTESEGGVTLESIETPDADKGQGKAEAALKKIAENADRDGVKITLKVAPKDATVDAGRLENLYGRNGFEMQEDGVTMVRTPKVQELTQEQKDVEAFFAEDADDDVDRASDNLSINRKNEGESKSSIFRASAITSAKFAANAIKKILPNVRIVLHEAESEYLKYATKPENDEGVSSGEYKDNVIHVNLSKVRKSTVAHEVFHAVLLDKVRNNDALAKKISDDMVRVVRSKLPENDKLRLAVEKHAARYEGEIEIQSEEQIAELIGLLSSNIFGYTQLESSVKSAIKNFLINLAKKLRIPLPKSWGSDQEVVDLINTLARKTRTGEEITEEDVKLLDVKEDAEGGEQQGSEGEVGKIKISRQQKDVIDAPSVNNDPRPWVRKVTNTIDVFTLNGKNFITNMYDYTNAGLTELGNGYSIELLGGRNYVPIIMNKTGKKLGDVSNLAAFNTKSQAEGFVRQSIEGDANYFAPHSGTLDGSWQFQQHIFEQLVDLVLDNNILSDKELISSFNQGLVRTPKALESLLNKYKKDVKSFNKKGYYLNENKERVEELPLEPTRIINALEKFLNKYNEEQSKEGSNLPKLKNTENLNDFLSNPKELVKLLNIENNFSPDLRKRLNQKIAANKKFQKAIGVKNLEEFHQRIIDPLNKGVVGGEIMTFIKFDPSTFEIVKTDPTSVEHHPSFGWVVKAKIEEISQPEKFHKSYDITEEYIKYNSNETVVSRKADVTEDKFKKSNVSSSAGSIPKVAKVATRQQRIDKTSEKLIELFDRDNIPLTIAEAKAMVEEVYDWTTWYDGISSYVNDLFGEYGEDVLSILPLSSMAANSAATVGMTINNVERIYKGEKPKGVAEYYGYVTDFLEGKGIRSDKMYNFLKALLGDKNAVAVDMHVYSIIMGKDPNKKQVNPSNKKEFERAKEFVNTLAKEMDLAPREVQAALWALNILRTNGKPDSYEQYFEKQVKERKLKERIEGWRNEGYKPFSEIRKTKEQKITPTTRQQRTDRLAPNGKRSNLNDEQYDIVRTPEFKRWFGDWETDPKNASKVVDKNGEPMVLYHGTNSPEGVFERGFDKENKNLTSRKIRDRNNWFWFSNNKEVARTYGTKVLEVFVSSKDMLSKQNTNLDQLYREAVKSNKDGLVMRDVADTLRDTRYIVFDNQRHYVDDKGSTGYFADELLPSETQEKIIEQLDDQIRYYEKEIGLDKLEEYEKEELQFNLDLKDFIEKNGKDAVTITERIKGDIYGIENPTQIKSADGSNTTFDPSKPSIRQQRTDRLAPNGKRSNLTDVQYDIVRTPAFKNWFGNWETDPENSSKVVDENGEPQVVWRGRDKTKGDVGDIIDISKTQEGAFFADNKEAANLFMSEFVGLKKGEYEVIESFLNIRNPEVFENFWNDFMKARMSSIKDNEYSYIPKKEFDGAIIQDDVWLDISEIDWKEGQFDEFGNELDEEIIKEIALEGKQFIALDSKQIKLADGSNTTFDPSKPSIRQQKGIQQAMENGEVIQTDSELIFFKGMQPKMKNGKPFSVHKIKKGSFAALDKNIALDYKGDKPLKQFTIPEGTTVEVVNLPSDEISIYRRNEEKAIDASDAQVVKLVTIDSRGKSQQYVIKDDAILKTSKDVKEETPTTPQQRTDRLAPNNEPSAVVAEDGWPFVRMPDGSYTDGEQIWGSWDEMKKVGEEEGLGLKQATPEREQEVRDREVVKETEAAILQLMKEGKPFGPQDVNDYLYQQYTDEYKSFKEKQDVWNYINDQVLKRMGYESPMEMSEEDLLIQANLVRKGVEQFEEGQLNTIAEANKIINSSKPSTRQQKSMNDYISKGREDNIPDDMIRDFLVRVKRFPTKKVDELLSLEVSLFDNLPSSFGNIKGGAKVGVKLYEKVEKFRIKEQKRNNKRKNKLTEQEIIDKTIEFLEKQPEYINEGDTYTTGKKKDGTQKTLFRKGISTQQARMLIDIQKSIGIRPTENMGIKIAKARLALRERRKGQIDIDKVRIELRNFIRKALPKELYERKEVLDLINKIAIANKKNINNLVKEIESFVIEVNNKSLEKKIKEILNNKYQAVEGGRLKPKKIADEIRKRIAFIKSNLVSPKATPEDIGEANEKLLDRFNEIMEQNDITIQQQEEMTDLQLAMQYNNAMLMENSNANKVTELDGIYSTLEQMIKYGRSLLQEELRESHEAYNRTFELGYEAITGDKVDMNDPEAKKKLNNRKKKRTSDENKKKATQGVIRRFLSNIKTILKAPFGSAEALNGLMERIDKLPGEMFGGRLNEMFTDRVDDSSRRFKMRMMQIESVIQNYLAENYGKDWEKISRNNRKQVDYNIELHDGIMLEGLSQDEIAYLYNMYKDPANRASFTNPEMWGVEVINKDDSAKEKKRKQEINQANAARVMKELESELDDKVKDFADWQVDVLYPALYEEYNNTYKKLYRTDLPWNKFYAGTIYRQGVTEEDIDVINLLGRGNMYKTAVGANATKVRQGSSLPIKPMNMVDVLNTYVNDMEYFAAYGETIRDMDKFFSNKYIKSAIIDIHGSEVYTFIDDMIKKIASRGMQSSGLKAWAINAMNTAFIVSRLALSPVIAIKQLTSTFTYANDIGFINWLEYSAKNKTQQLKVWKEISENSVYIQDRYRNSITKAIETYSDTKMKEFLPSTSLKQGQNWAINFAMYTTKLGDKGAIYLGGAPNYSYYKAQALKQGKTEQEAIDIAIKKFERDTKRTQQSSDLQDKDYLQTGDPLTRAMNMFMTTPKQYLRNEIIAVRNLYRAMRGRDYKGTVGQNVRTFVMYHVFMPVLFQYVSMGLPGILRNKRDEDKWDLLRAGVIGNLNALFLLGEVVNTIGDLVTGKPWAGTQTKSLGFLMIMNSIGRKINKAINYKDEKKKAKAMMDAYLEASTLVGVPAPTIAKFFDNYSKLGSEGDVGKIMLRLLNYSNYQIEGSSRNKSKVKTVYELNQEYQKQKEKKNKESQKKKFGFYD